MSYLIRRGALLSILLLAAAATAGQEQRQPAGQTEDVVRVNTELVQTDLMVLDKRGRFVEGLKPEQFELRVDGKPQPVAFFEQVTAGSADEETKLSAARGQQSAATPGRKPLPQSPNRGRVIFFFVDDVHLSADSLARTRKSLSRFVDDQMATGDLVAIVSTSGVVGFLQQLTDNKTMLHAAIERLASRRNSESYAGKVPISEADANRIVNHRDRELFAYLLEATKNEYQTGVKGGGAAGMGAVTMLKNRLRQIDVQGASAEKATLSTLEGLLRSSAQLAGRKLVFLISDGFVSDYRRSDGPDILRRVTEEAARTGAVVYTLDARGTFGDPAVDAGRNDYPDMGVRTNGRSFFDEMSTKEPLERIAAETGGRAFLNNNAFNDVFAQAVGESSNYYLLAWRPDTDTQRAGKSRIAIVVKGRPDLRVQMRTRFVSAGATQPASNPSRAKADSGKGDSAKGESSPSQPSAEADLRAALASLYALRDLPLALSVGYMDVPEKGTVIAASMQLDGETLDFGEPEAGAALLDVWGVALDDRGSFATFKQTLSVSRDALSKMGQRFVVWNQQLPLPPGLYQVRVAARDRRSGRTGSQLQWVEIPGPTPGGVSLSSIFIGERKASADDAPQRVSVNVSRRFERGSLLRYQTYVYNAVRGADSPDLTVEVQILRDGQPILTQPAGKPNAGAGGDNARVAISGEVALAELPAGRYALLVTATDNRTKARMTRQTDFLIE